MREFLEIIRKPQSNHSISTKVLITIGIAVGGFLLGILQKWIDGSPSNVLPDILNYLDIRNYFGRLAIWILLATIISIYAETALRAAINTFMFFTSMLMGYYLYCHYVLGFLPRTYMMIWVVISIISFFLAFICWYAKGEGKFAIIISSVILGVLFSQAILIMQGIYVTHFLEVVTWIIGMVVLYRKPKEFAIEIGLSFVVAFLFQLVFPYFG